MFSPSSRTILGLLVLFVLVVVGDDIVVDSVLNCNGDMELVWGEVVVDLKLSFSGGVRGGGGDTGTCGDVGALAASSSV